MKERDRYLNLVETKEIPPENDPSLLKKEKH